MQIFTKFKGILHPYSTLQCMHRIWFHQVKMIVCQTDRLVFSHAQYSISKCYKPE